MFPAPLNSPIGFGAVDFFELGLAILLVASVLLPAISLKPRRAMLWLAFLPFALRLLLLPSHPVPVPDIYDEFGHLLVADTLRHWRLANPPHALHQFFETFFVLQQPTYSSIYPIGNGLALAVGWACFGTPWAGVLLCVSAFTALCYWMLRGWTTPGWALTGGLLAALEFGALNQWTNSYWGGALPAAAGCLVYGSLPRLRRGYSVRDALLLGTGLAIHLLTRPYESIFLILSVLIFLRKPPVIVAVVLLPAIALSLLHNHSVTGKWTELPYTLSQYQYGVPASLTFQQNPTPHLPLTPQQEMDYRMQRAFRPGSDTLASYFDRLVYRTRYYRFYFYPPLYFALAAFLIRRRPGFVVFTCLLFALGTNFFPAFQYHYLAGIVCLFVLMSVEGLRYISELPGGKEGVRVLVTLCIAQFLFSYITEWNSGTRPNIERRTNVAKEVAAIPGSLLIFVRYWPSHIFQDEWVYNGADIDTQRVVWARDLGDDEDRKLIGYYKNRTLLLFEPDARPPRLTPYVPEPEPAPPNPAQQKQKPPLLELEQVR